MQINTSVAGGPKPTPRSFGEGRLLLLIPKREQTGTKYESKEPQQEIVCDVVVLADPFRPAAPILFGGKKALDGTMKEPDTHRVDIGPQGWLCENVVFSGGGMIHTLRRVLESTTTTGQQQAIVGRLWRDHSAEARGAWKIAGQDHEATPEEVNVAAAWYAAASTGQFTNSVPVPLNPVPAQPPVGFNPYGQQVQQMQQQPAPVAPPAPQYGQPQYPGQPGAQYGQMPQQPPAQPMPVNGGYPAAPPQYGQQQMPQANGGFPYGATPMAAPVPQSAPPAPAAPMVPPGIDADTWARWDENARQGFLAHMAQQAQYAQAAPQYGQQMPQDAQRPTGY